MRKRDVLRQLKKLQNGDRGRPTDCIFCAKQPTFVVYNEREKAKQTFVCDDHLGELIVTWTTAHQTNVVRL